MDKNIAIDNDEGCVKLKINESIYNIRAINAAAYAFLDKAYIIIDRENSEKIAVCLYPKENISIKNLGLEFYNELVSYRHYFDSQKENSETIKMIVERAVFSAAPTLLEEAEEQEINDLLNELEEEDDEEIRKIVKEIKNDKENKA